MSTKKDLNNQEKPKKFNRENESKKDSKIIKAKKNVKKYSLLTLIIVATICFLAGILANRLIMTRRRQNYLKNNQEINKPLQPGMGLGGGMGRGRQR